MRKIISSIILVAFLTSLITTPAGAQLLPVPGTPVTLSAGFQPPVLLGLKIHPENPLLFDFIVDQGASKLSDDELKLETEKLVKYFLAALTIPDKEVWVNLSPYEKDKIVPDALGQTAMGKTMLEQDYMLKQLASSLTNPEEKLGKEFWANVKAQVQSQLKTADVPMSTFNKVWIVPQKAEVLESQGVVIVGEKRLKVMMDQDYVALEKSSESKDAAMEKNGQGDIAKAKDVNSISSGIFKETVLPSIEKEINEGKNFADVRQIYNSVILATWYKKALKESLLGKVYADQSKVAGVETDDKEMKQKIYEQYLAAFKKGVYNLIKEESDSAGDMIPRKYFSGGIKIANFTASSSLITRPVSIAQAGQLITNAGSKAVRVQMAEPQSAELNIVAASSAFASSGVVGRGNNFITPQGPYAIWQLSSRLYNAGYRAEELGNFLNRIAGGNFRGTLSEDALDRLSVDQSQIKTIIDEWMEVVQKGNQFYFSGDRLAMILDLVKQSLNKSVQHNFLDFYLEDRAALYVPVIPTAAQSTQILFGNEKVTVEKTEDNQLKITDSQGKGSYVAALDEEVLVGRNREYPNGALKFTDGMVSGTHFGVTLRRAPNGSFFFFEIKDGYAPRGSANKTVVVTDGIPANSIRMLKPNNLLSLSEEFLSPPKEGSTFQQSRISDRAIGLVKVFVGGGIYNIWREGNKVLFQIDESSPAKSQDSRIFRGEVGTTYRVGSAESADAASVQGNDWFIQGNRSMSRMSSGGHFSFSLNADGTFTVTNLTLRSTGTLVKWVSASSAVTEKPASELLVSIAANAQAVYDMLADFEKPGVEVSEQFKEQMFQWKDNIAVLQQQAVSMADQKVLAEVEQQIAAIKNTIELSFHVWIKQGNKTALKDWKFTNSYDFQGRVMYHVVPMAIWQSQKTGDYYRSERFAADGFIHFSADIDTALAAAIRFYGQSAGEVAVLKVNTLAATGSGRVAIDNGQSKYPHLYGAMPTNAVLAVITLGRNKSGALEIPPEILAREQAVASSTVDGEAVLGLLQQEVLDLGLDAVKGSENIRSYSTPDGQDFIARLFRDKNGKEFTVFEVFRNENEVANYAILDGNLLNLPAEELWAKYLSRGSAASSSLTDLQWAEPENPLTISLGIKPVRGWANVKSGYFSNELAYVVRLFQDAGGKQFTTLKIFRGAEGEYSSSDFMIFDENLMRASTEQLQQKFRERQKTATDIFFPDATWPLLAAAREALGIKVVPGLENVRSGALSANRTYNAQIYQNEQGSEFTVVKIFLNDAPYDFVIFNGNLLKLSVEELQKKILDRKSSASSGVRSLQELAIGLGARILSLGPEARQEFSGLSDQILLASAEQLKDNKTISEFIGSQTKVRAAVRGVFDELAADANRSRYALNDLSAIFGMTAVTIYTSASSAISPVLEDSFWVNGYAQGAIASDIMNRNVVSYKKEDVVAAIKVAGQLFSVGFAAVVAEYENAETTQIYKTRAYQLLDNPAFRDSFMAAYVGNRGNYFTRLENQAKDAAAILAIRGQSVERLTAEFSSSYQGEPALKDIRAKRDLITRAQQVLVASSGLAESKRGELAAEISKMGLTPVANSIDGEFPDRREYVLRLYQNAAGDDYTVLQVNDAGGELRDFRIYEVDLTGFSPAQLQARYYNSIASSAVLTDGGKARLEALKKQEQEKGTPAEVVANFTETVVDTVLLHSQYAPFNPDRDFSANTALRDAAKIIAEKLLGLKFVEGKGYLSNSYSIGGYEFFNRDLVPGLVGSGIVSRDYKISGNLYGNYSASSAVGSGFDVVPETVQQMDTAVAGALNRVGARFWEWPGATQTVINDVVRSGSLTVARQLVKELKRIVSLGLERDEDRRAYLADILNSLDQALDQSFPIEQLVINEKAAARFFGTGTRLAQAMSEFYRAVWNARQLEAFTTQEAQFIAVVALSREGRLDQMTKLLNWGEKERPNLRVVDVVNFLQIQRVFVQKQAAIQILKEKGAFSRFYNADGTIKVLARDEAQKALGAIAASSGVSLSEAEQKLRYQLGLNIEATNDEVVAKGFGKDYPAMVAEVAKELDASQQAREDWVKIRDQWYQQQGVNPQQYAFYPSVAASSPAAVDANKFTKGGIDFDPAKMNLQIKRDGKGVPLPLPQQNLEQINIQGLVPIIINIVPMNTETLPIFLGQAEKEPGREPESAMKAAS